MAQTFVHPSVCALLAETGEADPKAAIRSKVRMLVEQYRSAFGEPDVPFKLEQLVSFCGVHMSDEPPTHSRDAELVPDGSGKVFMRINRNQPKTRQRFSMGHELSHTFFPGYERQVQCRPDPRHRDREEVDDIIEMLCDVGASEFLFPLPWFAIDAAHVNRATDLAALAETYLASRESTVRRFAEASPKNLVAIFFEWKIKPTQKPVVPENQVDLFGGSAAETESSLLKLRVAYSIASESFKERGLFVPSDKSVKSEGCIYEAAQKGNCVDAEEHLDLGVFHGHFRILAIPLATPAAGRGPAGEAAVVAVMEPLKLKGPKKRSPQAESAGLFS